ncbi:MAG: ABC transporter ATP-binding protein [Gammaproteobacteria bacterium]|nr:ABC transporter ATP-binding protein [Gammaproteobacteria bacterium]
MSRPKESNVRIIWRLLSHMRPFAWIMGISLAARVARIVSQAAVLGIAAASVGIYVAAHQPGAVIWEVIFNQVKWIAIAGAIVGVASYAEQYTGHYVAFRILAALRNRFYYGMLPLAPARTSQLQSGDAVSRVMSDCQRIEPFYAHTIAPAVAAIVVPGAILAWCYMLDASLAAVLAPFYLATTFLLPWLVAKLGGDGVSYREQLGQVNAYVADSIQGIRDTVAFGYEKRRGRELWRIGAAMHEGQDKLYGADATQRALGEIFVTAGILAAAWWGIELALAGRISAFVELPTLMGVSVIGFYTSIGLANNYTDFRVSMISARRLFSIMDQPPAAREAPNTRAAAEAGSPSLHFRNVTFEYGSDDSEWGRKSAVLENFSLDIEAGRHVAVAGPSGAGKSTLVNLLLRHWDPQKGEIAIGGQPLAGLSLAAVQKQFAVVSQRSYIFNESIRYNILFGRPGASDEEMQAAAQAAGLSEWIAALPEGYGSPVGERGSKLSGGQRQRIAIARAILKDAPVVLLDEPTSSLDVETEKSVIHALRRLCRSKTTLTIAHRLSTIVDSDEILVMRDGGIAERGSHPQLMAQGGWYAQMFTLQLDQVDAALAT